jgi:hypothetical protein
MVHGLVNPLCLLYLQHFLIGFKHLCQATARFLDHPLDDEQSAAAKFF